MVDADVEGLQQASTVRKDYVQMVPNDTAEDSL